MLKKSASGVLASLSGSTVQKNHTGSVYPFTRINRWVNGSHEVRYVPPRHFARCGLAGRTFLSILRSTLVSSRSLKPVATQGSK